MKISQVMKQGVSSCTANDSLNSAAQIMWDRDCGCVPVSDADGRLVGIITDRDIAMAAYLQGGPLRSLPVAGAMATPVLTCHPEDPIARAEAIMREHQVRRLPVVDAENHLVGMLSLNDIAAEASHELDRKKKEVSFSEVGATLEAVCRPRGAAVLAA